MINECVESIKREGISPIRLISKIVLLWHDLRKQDKVDEYDEVFKFYDYFKIPSDMAWFLLSASSFPDEIKDKVEDGTISINLTRLLANYFYLLKEANKYGCMDKAQTIAMGVRGACNLSGSKKPEACLKYLFKKVLEGQVSEIVLDQMLNEYHGVITERIAMLRLGEAKIEQETKIDISKYKKAIEKGEIRIHNDKLIVQDLTKEFTDQKIHFPKYSGQVDRGNLTDEDKLKTFTEYEWKELNDYEKNREEIKAKLFPDLKIPFEAERYLITETKTLRRIFDPEYGDFLVKDEYALPDSGIDDRFFVKKGWGEWRGIEFNDGEGHRTKRRYFVHGWLGLTLIDEMIKTANPDLFSDINYRKLNIHNVQKYEASWFYFRKKSLKRSEIIEAIKKDLTELESLNNVKPKSEEEMEQEVIELLSDYHERVDKATISNPHMFREGSVKMKRLPDGRVDREFYGLSNQLENKDVEEE